MRSFSTKILFVYAIIFTFVACKSKIEVSSDNSEKHTLNHKSLIGTWYSTRDYLGDDIIVLRLHDDSGFVNFISTEDSIPKIENPERFSRGFWKLSNSGDSLFLNSIDHFGHVEVKKAEIILSNADSLAVVFFSDDGAGDTLSFFRKGSREVLSKNNDVILLDDKMSNDINLEIDEESAAYASCDFCESPIKFHTTFYIIGPCSAEPNSWGMSKIQYIQKKKDWDNVLSYEHLWAWDKENGLDIFCKKPCAIAFINAMGKQVNTDCD